MAVYMYVCMYVWMFIVLASLNAFTNIMLLHNMQHHNLASVELLGNKLLTFPSTVSTVTATAVCHLAWHTTAL